MAAMSGGNYSFSGRHPTTRPRRLRQAAWVRRLVDEARLSVDDLIWPIFLTQSREAEPIAAMKGVERQPISQVARAAEQAHNLGIPAVALFPYTPPDLRDAQGSEALNPDNLCCRAIREIKRATPDLGVICDVALDPYTSHGHDGILRDGKILNDESVALLVKQALVQAEAGCDVIAPSDMMDGRIGAIRAALDENGMQDKMILSYAVKYASALYGPFRDAVGAAGVLQGDKKTYQMSIANSDEALRETALDIQQGADIVMVKPGLFYLDIVARVKNAFKVPVFAYQVSGEYVMIAASAELGAIEREAAILESLIAFRRAGADGILTYFALEAAKLLQS